ncbi:uncharacterized protein TNIN_241301 [Trichonephila inaurata madagascariensis]|uniref:Uncharacterized protein n=1 Tax=Trichonephila inaurata madagascariensis TaxID=2747483 RepID=A0A8X6X230_9ARAC|nr:uncharacterized protein TNIN_241301 [Trichonephila inaurata madagascariensis]
MVREDKGAPNEAQNCFGGIESFEKTTGTAFGPSVGTSVLLQQQDQALTRDCINLCKQQSQCLAFSLDYAGFRCASYNVNSVGRRDALEVRLNNNYFEKTCFHGVQRSLFENLCGDRLWAFERVRDAFLNGYVEKEVQNVQTKEECERLCLTEVNFICRSADYDEVMRVCRLSKEDRRSQPQAFREVVGSNRDYLENQCAASAPTSCRYDIRPGLSIISMDSLQFASSSDDCQVQCDSEATFNCRAYTYTSNRCFLSGDDSVSLGPIVLPEKPGATYGEKKCVLEQCTGGAFTYEKMTGFVLRSAVQNSIMVSNPGSLGNTLECQEYCQRDGLDCPAFSVNYQNMRCDKLDRNSQGRTQDLIPRDGENYFEKICLRGPVATACKDRAWAFERVLGHELEAQLYDRTVPFVQSRRDCEELCLEERSFTCRSALYNDDTTECKLSREDRRTLPSFYRRTNNMKVNYLENQCLPVLQSCPYEETSDSYPTYTDHIQMVGITSNEVCEQFCTQFSSFNCRSYAYYSSNGQCFLSGDDRASGGNGAVQGRPGLVYNERKCPAVTPPTEMPTTPTTDIPPPTRQCSHGEIMMLEKTTGYQHLGSINVLYRGNPDIPGIITECRRMCELNYECRAFTLDYLKQECYSGSETSTTKPKELIPAENKAFFEGICLPFYLGCSKQWMFDRYVDKELRGVQPRDVIRLISRTNCERRCLEEKRFVCRSANYYRFNQECRLFSEEQSFPHTQLAYAGGVDYLENQCNVGTSTCPYTTPERDMFMVYISKAIPGISSFELCRQLCMKEQDFNCRSYSYLEQGGINDLCLLSPENRQTGQAKAIRYRSRSLYQEVECRGQIPGTTLPTPSPGSTLTSPPVGSSHTPPTVRPPQPPPPPVSNRCNFEQYTYEKVVNYNLRFGRKERLVTRNPIGVVTECQSHCQRLGERCKGFVIEYSKYQQFCFWLDAYSSAADNTISPAQDTAYFEKICLSGYTCGKLWTFERVPGHDFHDVPILEMPGVPRRTDCEDLCVRNVPPCKSATYDTFRRICRLYADDRRSKPSAFARDLPEMEYLENQCASEPATCEYQTIPDHFFPYIDRLSRAFSLADCQRQCDLEDKFVCRSLNFETVVRDCALSSDDMISMQHMSDGLIPRPNSIYSEKGSCEQVSVQCNQQDMLLTVNFGSPFHGRVYAKGNPTQCYMVGTGQTTLLFAISLGTRCGTLVEGSGRYANEVVIQQHPVIVTNSDKTIKVRNLIHFYDLRFSRTRFQLPVTAIVTNTAPPPNLVMRVLDRTGRDAGVVGLGDELMLRIELRESASNLAIFARNLYARSKNGESLFLIDSTGCPTDPSIFPGLNLDARDRKSLFANFKAFRFPSTGLVNFEVQIRFCQDQCKPVRCSNNMESFGRKKRDIDSGTVAHSSSTPPSIKHHSSTKDTFSTASTQRHAHSNSHEPIMKLSPFAPRIFTPPLRNGTVWASNVTQVFGTFRVISSTESTAIKKDASDALKEQGNWRNVHMDNYRHGGLMNRSVSANDASINPGPRYMMDERKMVEDNANRWRYHTADEVQGDVSILPSRERPSSVIRQQSKEYPQSSRPPNPLRPSTTTPKIVNKSSRNYYSTPKHTSQFASRYAEKNDTYQGRGYGFVPTSRVSVSQTGSTQGRWPSKPNPSYGKPHRRPTPNRYYAYNTHVPPNSTTNSGDGRRSNASPYSDSSLPPPSLTTPELVISTMVPMPDELPLSLAIMVGEDTGVDVSAWKSKMKNVNPIESQADIESVGMVCTTVTTIAATTVTLSIAHVLGLIGAYCCYKWHRKSKRKKILQKSLKLPRPQPPPPAMRRPSGGRQEELFYAKPDVSFRNVYGSYGSSP